ncbi:hypothetical protein Q428_12250 [Fervidicella metallireducens AeB]|uniref:RNA polymerase sigma-70 region 2 domain-containing protein n=1 Tax=Fervidicella metallireducens AeB TaxID=1403537 RepID=A0A017RSB2_9CLOT|nr:sigma-70 family RNA polymerase sigma factor [Fervidicella metallireducens]EYE87638.1 hypothetical protein Q428_12250 [Fervidicella metallireducens AeB]
MKELIIKARENEEIKLKILKDFEPLIKKSLKMYLKDMSHFNDGMQEGYLTVLKCIYTYETSSNCPFPAYVKRAVIYSIRDFAKKLKCEVSLDEAINEDGGTLLDILPGDVDIEGDNIHKEDLVRLKEAINMLSEKQREVIEDYFFKNKSMVDICKGKRCHYMAVSGLKERAVKKLREYMEG